MQARHLPDEGLRVVQPRARRGLVPLAAEARRRVRLGREAQQRPRVGLRQGSDGAEEELDEHRLPVVLRQRRGEPREVVKRRRQLGRAAAIGVRHQAPAERHELREASSVAPTIERQPLPALCRARVDRDAAAGPADRALRSDDLFGAQPAAEGRPAGGGDRQAAHPRHEAEAHAVAPLRDLRLHGRRDALDHVRDAARAHSLRQRGPKLGHGDAAVGDRVRGRARLDRLRARLHQLLGPVDHQFADEIGAVHDHEALVAGVDPDEIAARREVVEDPPVVLAERPGRDADERGRHLSGVTLSV